jgi:hypothetical protein
LAISFSVAIFPLGGKLSIAQCGVVAQTKAVFMRALAVTRGFVFSPFNVKVAFGYGMALLTPINV